MLIFTIAYIILAVVAFAIYFIKYKQSENEQRLNFAAEKIVREEMLLYSLKNPYIMHKDPYIPQSKRIMMNVVFKSGGSKQSLVFDPSKIVRIGRSDTDQIVIFDSHVSFVAAHVYTNGGRVFISNDSNSNAILIDGRKIPRSRGVMLSQSQKVSIGGHKLKIKLFKFDYNNK